MRASCARSRRASRAFASCSRRCAATLLRAHRQVRHPHRACAPVLPRDGAPRQKPLGIGKGWCAATRTPLPRSALLGARPAPRYGLVFIDEGQDISANEYRLLRSINPDAAFNIYGDLAQNITRFRGVTTGRTCRRGKSTRSNRTTATPTRSSSSCAKELGIAMQPIGFDGPEVAHIGRAASPPFSATKRG